MQVKTLSALLALSALAVGASASNPKVKQEGKNPTDTLKPNPSSLGGQSYVEGSSMTSSVPKRKTPVRPAIIQYASQQVKEPATPVLSVSQEIKISSKTGATEYDSADDEIPSASGYDSTDEVDPMTTSVLATSAASSTSPFTAQPKNTPVDDGKRSEQSKIPPHASPVVDPTQQNLSSRLYSSSINTPEDSEYDYSESFESPSSKATRPPVVVSSALSSERNRTTQKLCHVIDTKKPDRDDELNLGLLVANVNFARKANAKTPSTMQDPASEDDNNVSKMPAIDQNQKLASAAITTTSSAVNPPVVVTATKAFDKEDLEHDSADEDDQSRASSSTIKTATPPSKSITKSFDEYDSADDDEEKDIEYGDSRDQNEEEDDDNEGNYSKEDEDSDAKIVHKGPQIVKVLNLGELKQMTAEEVTEETVEFSFDELLFKTGSARVPKSFLDNNKSIKSGFVTILRAAEIIGIEPLPLKEDEDFDELIGGGGGN